MQSGTEIDQLWRPSQWTNAFYFAVGGIALVIGIVVAFTGLGAGIPWSEKIAHGVWAAGLMLIVWKYLEIRCIRYQLSAEQLTASHGVLNRLTDNLELYRIKDTQVFEPIWLRLVGLGNVCIHSSDKTTPTLMVRAIPKPMDVATMVRRQVEAERVRKGVREFD
ncbi:PH domain-containing protein [Pseudohalioglobus lutimaris]|jgi:uncharacterized membrane protein YdbT with pleckstrin-like domain|nr:PH domain-containing protein [Pseudohalioglobus lutimaris]